MVPRRSRTRHPLVYRLVLSAVRPIVSQWGRLTVIGSGLLVTGGPTLVVSNHDSHWDPLVIGVAGLRRRQIRALAKSSLWRSPALGRVLNAMGQFPITRGVADRDELSAIVRALRAGACVGIFPEGTISCGKALRAFSGAGWLAGQVPSARVVAVAVTGAVDIVRFPRRPRITVEFFEPRGGQRQPDESSIGFARRVTAEIRDYAPPAAAGREAGSVKREPVRPVDCGPLVPAGSDFALDLATVRRSRYVRRQVRQPGPPGPPSVSRSAR